MTPLLRRQAALFPDLAGVKASTCNRYRPLLWRQWDATLPTMVLVTFHASYALDTDTDRIVTRAVNIATSLGFGRVEILAIFSARSDRYDFNDPSRIDLWKEGHEEHETTDAILAWRLHAMKPGDKLVCAWGHFKKKQRFRLRKVQAIIAESGQTPYVFTLAARGVPSQINFIQPGSPLQVWTQQTHTTEIAE